MLEGVCPLCFAVSYTLFNTYYGKIVTEKSQVFFRMLVILPGFGFFVKYFFLKFAENVFFFGVVLL